MKTAIVMLTLSAAALAFATARARDAGGFGEADQDTGSAITSAVDTMQAATSANDLADSNVQAFLKLIRTCEGTEQSGNPYAVVYGYEFTITDFSDHPAELGWTGGKLSDSMCRNAGKRPGCVSTAAGAYQFINPTWQKMGQPDFSADSQDAACIKLLSRLGALADVQAGRLEQATAKCSRTWASLPGNTYKQGGKSAQQVALIYSAAGGQIA